MTLAVAATFPWGLIGRALGALPGSGVPSSVILVTDSRRTLYDGTKRDDCLKIWKIAPGRGVGAVFAGDVAAAEEAHASILRRLRLLPRLELEALTTVASQALRQAYEKRNAATEELDKLHVLIGAAGLGSHPVIIRLESPSFVPQLQSDVQMVGPVSAEGRARIHLGSIEQRFYQGSEAQRLDDPIQAAVTLAISVYAGVIEPGQEEAVGGPLQAAVLSANGWQDVPIVRAHRDKLEWELITL